MSTRRLGPGSLVPPGEGRRFLVGGLELAILRTRDGGLHATQADCPHRRGPLEDGLVGAGTVICPLHARKFSLHDGAPVGHECAALRVYAVREQGGELFVDVPEGARCAQP